MENSNRLIEEEVEKEFNEKLVKIIQRARINNNTPKKVFVDDIKEIILKKVSEARQETLKEVEEKVSLILDTPEQIHGFQPFGFTDEEKERQIYFAGFKDGRAMLKIDLLKFKNDLVN